MEAKFNYIVADGSEAQREAIKAILSEGGYECVGEAEWSKEAKKLYFDVLPDFVIMDVDLLGTDGIECTRFIMENNPYAVIIMTSAMGQESMVIEALAVGAEDYLVKPYMKSAVLEKVGKVLEEVYSE